MKSFSAKMLSAWLLALLLVSWLSGCVPIVKAQFALTVGLGQNWEFVTTLLVAPEMAQTADEALNQRFAQEQEQGGVKVSWQRLAPDPDGNIPLRMTAKGQGYERLNRFLGQQAITLQDGPDGKTLEFHLDLGMVTAEQTEFTLHAGKMFSSNGLAVDDATVQWVNFSGEMQALALEPSWMDYLPWILLALAAILGLLMIFLLWLLFRPRRKPAPARPVKTASPVVPVKICPACRASIPAHAVFCPMCGINQFAGGK